MNKNEVIELLRSNDFKVAQVRCDIASRGIVCYPNEILLVCSEKKYNELVKPFSGQYTAFDDIDDFVNNCVYGCFDASKHYCNYYVENFHSVEEAERKFLI
jgi:hypothetical protein